MEDLRLRPSKSDTVGSDNFSEISPDPRYNKARIWCWAFNLISAVIAIWGLLAPPARMDAILAMALIPVAALILMNRFEGIAEFDAPRASRRPSTFLAFLEAPMLLFLRAMLNWNILNWSNLCIPAFVLSLLLFALSLWLSVEARQKRSIAIVSYVLSVIYGAGLALNLNGALADSPPIHYQAQLLEKYSTTGKYASDNFVLSPWGPQNQTSTESVKADVYHRRSVGDTVSISVINGALGIPFYSIE